MTRWDLGELARAAGAEITGRGLPMHVEAVGTDSRSLPPACLFVALRGDRFDGHAFVNAAIEAGASAVLIDEAGAEALGAIEVPALVVPDTLHALGDIAGFARAQHDAPLVAITGSNGKTTTKELCAAALGTRGSVHRTQGNFNNLIGLPLTLLDWPADRWACVAEMGMNAPGEIARLTEIAAPDVGVVTNAAAAHLEGLGTVDAVAEAKGELYAGLSEASVAVVNDDDERLSAVADRCLADRRRVRFGRREHCDVRIVAVHHRNQGLALDMAIGGTRVSTHLTVLGEHNAANAAAAAAAAYALGLGADEIAAGLPEARVPGGRMRLVSGRDARIIDDTYNANPQSMSAAFSTLVGLAAGARTVAVVGDMFELGPGAPGLHRQVGEEAARRGVSWLLALGEHAPDVVAGFEGVAGFGSRGSAHADLASLLADLDAGLRGGEWVLVKGSRGMKMERVVDHMVGDATGEVG